MANLAAWRQLQILTERAVRHFGLKRFEKLVPITHPRATCWGQYAPGSGVVEVRVNVIGRPNRALKLSTVKRWLAHELAHLRVETSHNREHKELTQAILEYWRTL